ncbi:MAG: hypothetical protein U0228_18965 [Myxococcaceae bacterium]
MVFGLFKKKPPPKKDTDPLEAWDQAIASLERQGVEVRKSAATLLALRKEASRERERLEQRVRTLDDKALRAGDDETVLKTLKRDRAEVERLLATLDESNARADTDSRLLMDTAEALAKELSELKEERLAARTRLSAGLMVSDALKARAASFEKMMKLDAARDEVERAHALAELYRDEAAE